jgi:hypothetical protein
MLATHCKLAKSNINEVLKEYVPYGTDIIITSYFDDNDILFLVGTMKNLTKKDILIIVNECTPVNLYKNFNTLITIMNSVLLNNNYEIIIFMIDLLIETNKNVLLHGKSIIWIEIINKAIDNGYYEIIVKLSRYIRYQHINHILNFVENKIKEIELSNNTICIIGLIHLFKHIHCNDYPKFILNILLQKSHFSLIDEFIKHLRNRINKKTLVFIISKTRPSESYKYFFNRIKINKNILIDLINELLLPIESYEYLLDHIKINVEPIFFDKIYIKTFDDVKIIQKKTLHLYAKKLITLLSNQMIISECNRHDTKRRIQKNEIKYIIKYFKDEQIKRNLNYGSVDSLYYYNLKKVIRKKHTNVHKLYHGSQTLTNYQCVCNIK